MGRKLKYTLYSLVAIFFFIGLVVPVLYTVSLVFFSKELVTSLQQVFSTKLLVLLLKSIGIATSIALLSTFFGGILGFILNKTKLKWQLFFKTALLIPLFISPYLLAVAWQDFMQLVFHANSLFANTLGVILVLTSVFTPLSLLIISSGLQNIDGQIEEAGILSVGVRNTLIRIVIPLLKPAIQLSFVLVFIFSLSEFSVPAFFGIRVFTTEIFTQFSAFYHHTLAVLQALFLIILSLVLVFYQRRTIVNLPFFSMGGKGVRLKVYQLKNKNTNWLILSFWIIISIVIPILVLVYQISGSFFESLSKAWQLLAPSFLSSFVLASFGALISVSIGFVVAYYYQNSKNTNKKYTMSWMLLFTFVIPSTVYGISFIKFYNHPFLNFIYSSSFILILGYVGKFSFVVLKIIDNAFKQIPKSLFEIASVQGVSFYKKITKLVLPLLFPALFTSFIVSFVFALGELGTSIMLYPPGTSLMPIKVFTIMANAPQALNSAMSLIVLCMTLVSTLSFFILAKAFLKRYSYD